MSNLYAVMCQQDFAAKRQTLNVAVMTWLLRLLKTWSKAGNVFCMRPLDIQQIGEELGIKWEDGTESFVSLKNMRQHCPCAGCKGEVDIMGNLYKNPDRPLSSRAFELLRIERVGGYAIQPIWADGHATGMFSFDYLKQVGESSAK